MSETTPGTHPGPSRFLSTLCILASAPGTKTVIAAGLLLIPTIAALSLPISLTAKTGSGLQRGLANSNSAAGTEQQIPSQHPPQRLRGSARPPAEMLANLIDQIVSLPDLDPLRVQPILGMKTVRTEAIEDFRQDYLFAGGHPLVRSAECRWTCKGRHGVVILEIDPRRRIQQRELLPRLLKYGQHAIVSPSPHAPPDAATTSFRFKLPIGELWVSFPGFPPSESAPLKSVMIDQVKR